MRTPQAERDRRHVLGALGILSLASGCASIGADLAPRADAAAGLQGQASFFDARTGKYLNRRGLIGSLAPAPILLLGEIHDNADHHRLRGTLLRQWVSAVPGRPAAIVFEHFDREHDEALRLAQRQLEDRSTPASQLTQLLDAAGFDRRSWGWPVHLPLFEAALASGATWIAANLSRGSAQRLSRDPGAAVDPALQAMVESARWSEQAQQALEQALIRGHCNALPDAAAGRLARVQRLRDAALALPLLDASDRRSALLAGNGHVRRDYGVPRYLGAFEKEALVLGFDEVVLADLPERAGVQAGLSGYVGETRARELGQAYDLVCLTTAAGRDDGCAGIGVGPVSPAAPMQTPSR